MRVLNQAGMEQGNGNPRGLRSIAIDLRPCRAPLRPSGSRGAARRCVVDRKPMRWFIRIPAPWMPAGPAKALVSSKRGDGVHLELAPQTAASRCSRLVALDDAGVMDQPIDRQPIEPLPPGAANRFAGGEGSSPPPRRTPRLPAPAMAGGRPPQPAHPRALQLTAILQADAAVAPGDKVSGQWAERAAAPSLEA